MALVRAGSSSREREFVIDNLLVRIHLIIVMIRWTSLAPWEFEFPFPGSLTATFRNAGAGESGAGARGVVVQPRELKAGELREAEQRRRSVGGE